MEQHSAKPTIDAFIGTLTDMAIMLELLDENPFKVRALQNAIRSLEDAPLEHLDLETIASLPGIGKGIFALVQEFSESGAIREHTTLQERVPESVLEMTKLRGLGAKKVRSLWQELGISSIAELTDAAREERIAKAKGFGTKTQHNILEAIAHYRAAKEQVHLHTAWNESMRLCRALESLPEIRQCSVAGAARCGEETIRRITLVADCLSSFNEICNTVRAIPECHTAEVVNSENYCTLQGTTEQNLPYHIILTTTAFYPIILHKASSTPDYHQRLMDKLKHTERDTVQHDVERTTSIYHNEKDIYRAAHLPLIPAELRTNPDILDRADIEEYIADLAEDEHIRGILHVHSTWSDGKHTIRQMAERAQTLGYEYIAICDHSKTAIYAGGLSEERVQQQHEEIDRLNEEFQRISPHSIHILKGIESDILRDGSLDYSDTVLDTFDVVVASVHSSFTLDKDTMTDRICKALEHPKTTLLGHPTGRLLLMRKGYEFDMEAVLETAQKHGKAIEINANPYRLDLTAKSAALAQAFGVEIAINTDAHNMEDIGYMRYGMQVARRAGLMRTNVINTLSFEEFCRRWRIIPA